MRTRLAFVIPLVALSTAPASAQSSFERARDDARQAVRRAMADANGMYQGRRGPEQSDTFSRKIKLGRNGHVSLSNIAGQITVTAGTGDEMSIDAVKRTRGDRRQLDRVNIFVDEHAGRVEVRTDHPTLFRSDNVSVDYTVTVPADASLEVFSTSGDTRVSGVKGSLRLGSVSGNITTANTPHLESARTVSGELDLADVSHDDGLSVTTVSGNIRVAGLKTRTLDLSTVSGNIVLRDAATERLNARSVSGDVEYGGGLARNGRYEINSHSGSVRLMLSGSTGFELHSTSFSGAVRSEFPMTVGGDRNPSIRPGRGRGSRGGEGMQATYGDGSALLNLRTFSGDIVLAKR